MAIAKAGGRDASQVVYRDFRGFCRDTDAAELPPELASDAQNVDFDGETVRKRLGRVAYNTSLGAGKVLGATAYYPPGGGTRKMVLAWTTTVKADDGAGTFSNIVTSLSGSADHVDLALYRDRLYIGNGIDPLQRWNGTGSAAAIALLTPPSAAPTLELRATVAESFETATTHASDITAGWVRAGSGITLSLDTDIEREGSNALKASFASGSRGSSFTKKWSSGSGILDLSTAESLVVWVYAEKLGMSFQVGIIENGETTVDFSKFRTHVVTQKEAWVPVEVPLAQVPPSERTASPGIGIRFNDKRAGMAFPVALWLDQAQPKGPLDIGTYQYRYTWYASSTGEESNPSPAAVIEIPDDPPAEGVYVTPATSGTTETDLIRIFRYFELGTLQWSHLIGTAPNDSTTLGAAVSDTTGTSWTATSALGISRGNVLQVGTEKVLVREVSGTTLTVVRGVDGSTAATHSNGATLSFVKHFDTLSQGGLILSASDRLAEGKTTPPIANCYAIGNNRLVAADVTVGGTRYPWQLWLSRDGFPEEFGNTQDPEDPTLGGWINLPERDPIRRVMELEGAFVVFTDRAVWTLEGSGWDNYEYRKRAEVGLDGRNAVAVLDRAIVFLASDGVRVLRPGYNSGIIDTYVISEPVDSLLRAIPKAYRSLCSMGVDERGRLHLSYPASGQSMPTVALVFDPTIPGAMASKVNETRPGWTFYSSWGFGGFTSLKRGGGDNAELIGWDTGVGKLWRLHTDASGADLHTDDGGAIAWHWQSAAEDAGAHGEGVWSSSDVVMDAATGSVTVTAIADRGNNTQAQTKALPSNTAITTVVQRWGTNTRARFHQIKIAGSHSVGMRIRAVSYSLFVRGR